MNDMIFQRIVGTREWLAKNGNDCHKEQAHLDPGTRERIYWHYGYLMALKDVSRAAQADESMSRH